MVSALGIVGQGTYLVFSALRDSTGQVLPQHSCGKFTYLSPCHLKEGVKNMHPLVLYTIEVDRILGGSITQPFAVALLLFPVHVNAKATQKQLDVTPKQFEVTFFTT